MQREEDPAGRVSVNFNAHNEHATNQTLTLLIICFSRSLTLTYFASLVALTKDNKHIQFVSVVRFGARSITTTYADSVAVLAALRASLSCSSSIVMRSMYCSLNTLSQTRTVRARYVKTIAPVFVLLCNSFRRRIDRLYVRHLEIIPAIWKTTEFRGEKNVCLPSRAPPPLVRPPLRRTRYDVYKRKQTHEINQINMIAIVGRHEARDTSRRASTAASASACA
jgi:hypothetical protein